MNKMLTTLAVAFGLAACSFVAASPAGAQQEPTIMVGGEDWDLDTFERDNQASKQVLDGPGGRVSDQGVPGL